MTWILSIRKRQKKLVNEEIRISDLRPSLGSSNAPDKLLAVRLRLLKLQRKAKEVASRPLTVVLAIRSRSIIKINIPRKL